MITTAAAAAAGKGKVHLGKVTICRISNHFVFLLDLKHSRENAMLSLFTQHRITVVKCVKGMCSTKSLVGHMYQLQHTSFKVNKAEV